MAEHPGGEDGEADRRGERWVFGYGSLMWRPEFAFVERRIGLLAGLARAFCIYSVHHRGTRERPGLVLGLAPGAGVRGAAYAVTPIDWPSVYAYLTEREQPTETYVEASVPILLDDGRTVEAVTFLSDTHHPQWAGVLSPARQAELIAGARGLSGRNIDYLRDLIIHLREMGEADPAMEALLIRVERLEAEHVPADDAA